MKITNYPNYELTNLGEIINLKKNRKLKPTRNSRGYLTVKLYNNEGRRTHSIHQLVAEHFIAGKTKEKCQINHKDENKLNNNIDNLEWVTPQENTIYSK